VVKIVVKYDTLATDQWVTHLTTNKYGFDYRQRQKRLYSSGIQTHRFPLQQDRQCMYNVTMRHVRATIVTVKNQ